MKKIPLSFFPFFPFFFYKLTMIRLIQRIRSIPIFIFCGRGNRGAPTRDACRLSLSPLKSTVCLVYIPCCFLWKTGEKRPAFKSPVPVTCTLACESCGGIGDDQPALIVCMMYRTGGSRRSMLLEISLCMLCFVVVGSRRAVDTDGV